MTAAAPLQDHASRFTHALRFDMLPDAVIRDAQRCLLDLLGVAAAGTSTRMSSIAREHALDCFAAGRTPARMLFDGGITSPTGAATIDSFDGHDGHALTKGHAGVTVLPALLAMTERAPGMSGREFIVQTVLGYELGTRAGIALHATSREYHTSGVRGMHWRRRPSRAAHWASICRRPGMRSASRNITGRART